MTTPPRSIAGAARALVCAGIVAASWLPSPARADGGEGKVVTEGDRAAALKDAGDAAMRAGSYEAAYYAYRDAYAVSPQPAVLYNLARAEQQLHRYAEALKKLEQFVDTAPADVKARVPRLDDLVADVRSHVATLTVHTNVPGARVALRGHYVASTPMRYGVRAAEGKAQVEVSAPGYQTVQRDVGLEGGRSASIDVTLAPIPGAEVAVPRPPGAPAQANVLAPAPAPSGAEPVTSKWWFWTGVGVAIIGGVGVTATLLNQRSHDAAPARASAALLTF